MAEMMTNKRIFREAGVLTLIKQTADGRDSTDPKDIWTSDGGIVDNVTTSYNKSTSEMNDGNSMFAAGTYLEKVAATVVPQLNTIDPKLWSFLTGGKIVTRKNDPFYMSAIEKVITKGEGAAYQIDMGNPLAKDSTILVRSTAYGTDFTKVASGETEVAVGSFKVDYDTGILTFNAEDVNKVVFISCYFLAPETISYEVPAIPENPTFKIILSGRNYDVKETNMVYDNYIVDSVRVSGDVPLPPRQKTLGNWSPTFNLEKPRPGAQAISWQNAAPFDTETEVTEGA